MTTTTTDTTTTTTGTTEGTDTTTTGTTEGTTTDSSTTTAATTTAVDRLLAAIESGAGGSVGPLYTAGAVLDATVPNWRFGAAGGDAIAAEYARWFSVPGVFEELTRRPTPHGEVVTYALAWEENGVPYLAHHCHVLTVVDGRIDHEQVWCGGRWSAELLAEMEAARHAQ